MCKQGKNLFKRKVRASKRPFKSIEIIIIFKNFKKHQHQIPQCHLLKEVTLQTKTYGVKYKMSKIQVKILVN